MPCNPLVLPVDLRLFSFLGGTLSHAMTHGAAAIHQEQAVLLHGIMSA
jgi:hypothetical protein